MQKTQLQEVTVGKKVLLRRTPATLGQPWHGWAISFNGSTGFRFTLVLFFSRNVLLFCLLIPLVRHTPVVPGTQSLVESGRETASRWLVMWRAFAFITQLAFSPKETVRLKSLAGPLDHEYLA